MFESFENCKKEDDDMGNTGSPQINRTSKSLYKTHVAK